MKIRRFNEYNSYRDYENEIKEYFEENLAYLLDNNFRISINEITSDSSSIGVELSKEWNGIEEDSYFYWREVNDNLIPFLQTLDDKYELIDEECIEFFGPEADMHSYLYYLSHIIDEEGGGSDAFFENKELLNGIIIYIKKDEN